MSQSNVSAMLQSTTKNWELTPYELQRVPQEVVTDNTEIAVSPRSLHNELMCPICLDMLRCTMTTKECLHRFCAECITTALRAGNKECPTCRKKLVSRRSLRPDPNFDALIAKIYPSRDEYEAHQERMLQSLTKHHTGSALSESIEEGLKSQALNRLQKIRKQDNMLAAKACEATREILKKNIAKKHTNNGLNDSTHPMPPSKKPHLTEKIKSEMMVTTEDKEQDTQTKSQGPSSTCINMKKDQGKKNGPDLVTTDSDDSIDMSSVEMIFKPHPDQKGTDVETANRYIKTKIQATVSHLKEFIKVRITLEIKQDKKEDTKTPEVLDTKTPPEYDVYVYTEETYQLLPEDMTLETLQELYWKKDHPLEIFYLKMK